MFSAPSRGTSRAKQKERVSSWRPNTTTSRALSSSTPALALAGLDAVASEQGGQGRAKHGHQHIYGPGNPHGQQRGGVARLGRKNQGGHRGHQLGGQLRGQTQQQTRARQGDQSDLDAARGLSYGGQVGGGAPQRPGF